MSGQPDAGLAGRGDRDRLPRARRRRSGCRCRSAFIRDRRGHRIGVVCRHERELSQYPGPRRGNRRRAALLDIPIRSTHDLLPRQAWVQPQRHGHRGRRAAPDRVHPRRRDVHDRSSHGQRRPPRDRGGVRARRVRCLRAGVAGSLRRRQAADGNRPSLGSSQGADHRAGTGRRHFHA